MDQLFVTLTEALSGGGFVPALASFAWGALSILLSPCHLVSIPLVVAFTSSRKDVTWKTGLVFGGLFAVGMLLTVIAVGVATAALGRFLGNTGTIGLVGQLVAAAVLIVVGLWLSGILKLSFLDNLSGPSVQARRGRWAAFITGLVFGLSAGPCTFAWMAPILAVTFRSAGADITSALWLFGWFALGHGGILVLAGVFSGQLQKVLNWNSAREGTVRLIKIVFAVLIVLGGITIAHDAISKF